MMIEAKTSSYTVVTSVAPIELLPSASRRRMTREVVWLSLQYTSPLALTDRSQMLLAAPTDQ